MQSFVSPLDRAVHSSDDSSSTLGNSTNSSKSGFNFYQVSAALLVCG